jgi:hypothetical protein
MKVDDNTRTTTLLHESVMSSSDENDVAENIKHEIAHRVMNPAGVERDTALQ